LLAVEKLSYAFVAVALLALMVAQVKYLTERGTPKEGRSRVLGLFAAALVAISLAVLLLT
jgi:hypothetical protein